MLASAMPSSESTDVEELIVDKKRICPYCDVYFIVAILFGIPALILSLAQYMYGILGLIVFSITLGNCFCQSRTKRMGLIAAGSLECAFSVLCLVHVLDIVSDCDPNTFRYFHCSISILVLSAGLWLISGILILYFVFSGRIREYVKEGLDIEAVATPIQSIDGTTENPEQQQEQGNEDDSRDTDDENDIERSARSSVVSFIPDSHEDENEGESDERRQKLTLCVPFTPARMMEISERSDVSYLPNGTRDYSSG